MDVDGQRNASSGHQLSEPAILYFGTPVVLVSTLNEDSSALDPAILADGAQDRIDPDRWQPLIRSFQRFYGLVPTELASSSLAQVPESLYRSPDVDGAGGRPCWCATRYRCSFPATGWFEPTAH